MRQRECEGVASSASYTQRQARPPGSARSGSRHAAARRRSSPARGRSQGGALPGIAARIRWDRLGRGAMLCVLLVLLFLYVSAGVSVFNAWRTAKRDSAQVLALERQHSALQAARNASFGRASLEEGARLLGWAHPGEQAYVVTKLPSN